MARFNDARLSVDYVYDALGRRLSKSSYAHHRKRSEAGSQWNHNQQARKQRELGCGFTLYGWDGDTLAWESTPARADDGSSTGRCLHYIFEPGSFVPVAQAIRQQPIRLLAQPTYEGAYDIDEDPLLIHKPKAPPLDAQTWYHCDHLGTPQELTDRPPHLQRRRATDRLHRLLGQNQPMGLQHRRPDGVFYRRGGQQDRIHLATVWVNKGFFQTKKTRAVGSQLGF